MLGSQLTHLRSQPVLQPLSRTNTRHQGHQIAKTSPGTVTVPETQCSPLQLLSTEAAAPELLPNPSPAPSKPHREGKSNTSRTPQYSLFQPFNTSECAQAFTKQMLLFCWSSCVLQSFSATKTDKQQASLHFCSSHREFH